MVVGNLGDPIKLSDVQVNGIAAEAALPGSTIMVWTRLAITSDEPVFHRVVRNIEVLIAHHAKLAGKLINLSSSNSVLLVIRPDNSAELWIDTAAVIIRALAKRDMQPGSPVFEQDIGDVTAMAFPCASIGPSDRLVYVFRQDWRFALFFDFNPDGNLSLEDTQRELGTLFRRLKYCHLYDWLADQAFLSRIIQAGWFPFVEIVGREFEILANPCDAGFELIEAEEQLLQKFDNERLERMFRRWMVKPHFKPKEPILRSALDAYKRRDSVAVLKIVLTEIEGILAETYRAVNGKGAKLEKLLEFAARSAEQKAGVPDSLLFPSAFGRYLGDYTFANFDPTSGIVTSSSRHAVGHGAADASSYTMPRALQALLTLDQLAFYT
jgi:hypothetical protein